MQMTLLKQVTPPLLEDLFPFPGDAQLIRSSRRRWKEVVPSGPYAGIPPVFICDGFAFKILSFGGRLRWNWICPSCCSTYKSPASFQISDLLVSLRWKTSSVEDWRRSLLNADDSFKASRTSTSGGSSPIPGDVQLIRSSRTEVEGGHSFRAYAGFSPAFICD
ncbi:hypothetical protein CDAR_465611 [Caerostris darwini]|uniref:Uncharacterized protein n=1 Tax=Caerostris darwini TaxID=1538125 RepID=A0AAV4TY90_9ARAC|nr:hypothetical protein CDAR_465611 [Caerostris darwini]